MPAATGDGATGRSPILGGPEAAHVRDSSASACRPMYLRARLGARTRDVELLGTIRTTFALFALGRFALPAKTGRWLAYSPSFPVAFPCCRLRVERLCGDPVTQA